MIQERPLLAESGLSNLSFAAILVSAIHPKADVKLISTFMAANDPKRTLRHIDKILRMVDIDPICSYWQVECGSNTVTPVVRSGKQGN